MGSKRIAQVNELIRREITQIISKEIEFPPTTIVTVFGVETSPDLEHARVSISVFPDHAREKAMRILENNIFHIQKILNQRLVMRFVPKIHFRLDLTESKADRINSLLDNLGSK
jgi:ribosome-binding factor A